MWPDAPLPPIFDGLSPADLEVALSRFRPVEALAGMTLIVEGEHDPTLVMVQSGELEVTDHGVQVGRVRVGGMAGEMAFFTDGRRRASVSCIASGRLLVLDRPGYDWLRHIGHPVAWALEEQALRELTARQRHVADRLSLLGKGTTLERLTRDPTGGPSLLRRLAQELGTGGLFRPGSLGKRGRASVLARSPLFDGVPTEALAELAEHFQAFGARRGQPICVEGQEGNELYVIDSGRVELMVSTRAGRVARVASLGPGDAFGIGSLVRLGSPRHATAVACERVVAVTLHKLRWGMLGARGDMVGSVLRVALIRALTEQLDFANEQLAEQDPAILLGAEAAFDVHKTPFSSWRRGEEQEEGEGW
jgi:CRP-like cAMP-binding protein